MFDWGNENNMQMCPIYIFLAQKCTVRTGKLKINGLSCTFAQAVRVAVI
jgi:hypothetical protein